MHNPSTTGRRKTCSSCRPPPPSRHPFSSVRLRRAEGAALGAAVGSARGSARSCVGTSGEGRGAVPGSFFRPKRFLALLPRESLNPLFRHSAARTTPLHAGTGPTLASRERARQPRLTEGARGGRPGRATRVGGSPPRSRPPWRRRGDRPSVRNRCPTRGRGGVRVRGGGRGEGAPASESGGRSGRGGSGAERRQGGGAKGGGGAGRGAEEAASDLTKGVPGGARVALRGFSAVDNRGPRFRFQCSVNEPPPQAGPGITRNSQGRKRTIETHEKWTENRTALGAFKRPCLPFASPSLPVTKV